MMALKQPQPVIDRIGRLWADKNSFGNIAELMGLSKGQVAGIVHRNGFKRPEPKKPRQAKPGGKQVVELYRLKPIVFAVEPETVGADGVSLLRRNMATQCAKILPGIKGDYRQSRACGQPITVAGTSWCNGCRAVVFGGNKRLEDVA